MLFTPIRLSALALVLAALILIVLHVNSASRRAEIEAENARNAFAADLQSGKLNTPDAFEARCMTPQRVIETVNGTELEYSFAEIHVTFGRSRSPIIESETIDIGPEGKVKSHRIPASPSLVFELLGCR